MPNPPPTAAHHRLALVLVLGLLAVLLTSAVAVRPARTATSAEAWHLVGLGDSVTSGADCPGCVRFLDLYAARITHDTAIPVSVTNLGVPGATSTDLLAALAEPATEMQVASADIISITIGANDFTPQLHTALQGHCGGPNGLACFAATLRQLHSTLAAILARIRQLRQSKPTAIRMLGYWNVFLDGEVATATYGPAFHTTSSALTVRVNAVIAAVSTTNQVRYVDLYRPSTGLHRDDDTALLTPDGDHPNQAGHQQIAESLRKAGYAPLPMHR
jgi:lysophospholipase L1-like esterase